MSVADKGSDLSPVDKEIKDLETSSADRAASPPDEFAIDPAAERRLLWKLDLCIFPVLYVIYTLSFLDRINIGNARIQGMLHDLDLTGNRYNILSFIYFIPYILLEVPSNMIIRKVRPSLYLGGLMVCWGIINMCMGFVKSYGAMIALRLLLGIFEAGVLPGMIYLTSMYYKRHEYQKRLSVLFSSTLVGGAFGGLLAYAIADLGGQKGYAAWRWIFIIEGAVTTFIAFISMFLIVDWPEQCRYLTAEEKTLLKRRLATDGSEAYPMDTLNNDAVKRIFSDWKIWLGLLQYLGLGETGYAVSYFLPTILMEFGWTAQEAQVHTIPVYVVAGVAMLLAAWVSDRTKQRYLIIVVGSLVATLGYGMLLGQSSLNRNAKYAACFLITMGGYTVTPIAIVWLSNNVSGHWKRAFSSGMQVSLGNIAGIIGSNVFLANESPKYPTGYGVSLATIWLGLIAATISYFLLRRENKKRDAGERDDRLREPEETVKNMGDDHPGFRFTL